VDPPIQQESLLQWSNIPIKTPLQAHLGTKEAAHAHWASALDSRWQLSILTHGGFHSHGLHSAEERVYTYPEMASGDFEKKEESRERMIGIIWARIFTFFRMHLKEL
jgi:hypothetical protein